MANLTVLIPTLASNYMKPYCVAAVASLKKHTPEVDIIVISNGENRLETKIEGCLEVHTAIKGQCHAVNLGLELVKTKYVMVSNDDMIYGKEWYRWIMDAMRKRYNCISLTPVEPKSPAEPFYLYRCGEHIEDFDEDYFLKFEKDMEEKIQTVSDGFNLPFVTETSVFKAIEGYDEKYDPGGSNSDPDIMHKMMIAGIRPMRAGNALVYHFSMQSGSMEADRDSWWANWRYFPQKWGFERDGRNNIWYAGGKNGTRIPTEDKPYVFEGACGHYTHPGKDWLEYKPEWMGKFGKPFYGDGDYYGN